MTNIFIELILIWCINLLVKENKELKFEQLMMRGDIVNLFGRKLPKLDKRVEGLLNATHISAKISEKLADRAFSMASSANLGVIALQKALAVPRLLTKPAAQQNQLAKKQIDDLYEKTSMFDFLRPVANDAEQELMDKLEQDIDRAALEKFPIKETEQ